jgi:ATP-binding cassette subfamily C exporter for protease/lipase
MNQTVTVIQESASVSAGPVESVRKEGKGLNHWLGTFRREIWVVAIFSLVANLMMLAPTLYMLQVFDRVLTSRSELTLVVLSLVALFFFAAMAFAEWSRSRVLVRVGVRMNDLLSVRVFRASFDAHLRRPGLQPARPLSDLTELRQFLTGTGTIAFFDAPWTPIYIGVLFFLHPVLGWAAIVFALIQGALAYWGHRRSLAPAQDLSLAQGQSVAQIQAKLRTSEAVEAMGMLESLRTRWQRYQLAYLQQHAITHGAQHRVTAVSKWVRYAQQSLALGIGALLVIDGELSAGAMIAANVLTTRALAPIDMLVGSWRGFLSARQAYQRLSGLLYEFDGEESPLRKVPPAGVVEVENVTAAPPNAAPGQSPILHGINLKLMPGTITVVVGPSGSGKSTLARILMGVWPASQGQVWWGEHPMSNWTHEELGPHVGYLPQDVELFDGTIAENIARLGEVESEQVIAAAKSAGLHDALLRFPKGYDTPVGAAGGLLSGGQRQRLGLARALYGEPALIVLDEPNANLDDVGEAALLKSVLHMKALGSTVVLISHRTGVLQVADQVVLMQDGRIARAGKRDEVLGAVVVRPAGQ